MAEQISIARWLERLGLGEHAATFVENRIDAETLRELTADDLKELGITALGDRKKLLKAIADFQGDALSDSDTRPSPSARDPEHRVPPHLAERILGSRAALEGERKRVTVLFADVKGSLELIQGADPEEASRVLDRVIGSLIDAVHRFEGTINQVQGDGLMALFGAPIAHEDHAVRACYAALAMQDAVRGEFSDGARGQPIQIRVGLHAGEVVVRAINTDLSMTYDAVGPTVHLAARMEHLAPPGEIYLTAETLRLVEGFVDVEPQGPMEVKGLGEPVEVFALRGAAARTRWQAALARGLSRFVGREASLEILGHALKQAGEGRGQLVAIVGEAGVGKSRLVYEFARSQAAQRWQVLAGSSVSYGKATDWLPVIELCRAYFGIEAGDELSLATAKVQARLEQLDSALMADAPAFLALLELAVADHAWAMLGARQKRRRTLDALQRLFTRESQRQPLILVFEDLHWIDSETQALLDELIEQLPGRQILLLVNYRPEYGHRWANRSHYLQLRLDPLEEASAEAMLAALLGDDLSLSGLKRRLIEDSAGNPLYLEESVRALVETGTLAGEAGAYRLVGAARAVALPPTLQALIAQRIDRLNLRDKQLLQTAAVIGTNVPLTLLQNVAEQTDADLRRSLGALQEAEFLYPGQLFPETEYRFKHAHTHQVAYAGLLQARRRTLHARVADAMATLYPERRSELAEKLAEHYEQAERWQEAVEYYLLAAGKGKAKYTYQTASDYAQRALKLAAAKSSDENGWQVKALAQLGDLASLQGQLDAANEHYEQAVRLTTDSQLKQDIANRMHRRRFACRDGARLAFYEHGSGSQALLLVMATAYRIAFFQPVVELLCQEFRVVTVDPRGTGASDPVPERYSQRQRAEDLRAVLEALSCGPVVAAGMSAAGRTVTWLAYSHPELVEKLILVGTPPAWPGLNPEVDAVLPARPDDQQWKHWWDALASGDFSEFDDFINAFAYTLFTETDSRDLAEDYIKGSRQLPRAVWRNFATGYPDDDIVPLLGQLRTPTLVAHGTADCRVPFSFAPFLVERIPSSQLYAFHGKGHLPPFTAPQEFCHMLRQFARTGTVPERPGIGAEAEASNGA